MALAVQSLAAHLAAREPRVARGPLPKLAESLVASLNEPYHWDRQRFGELLGEVEAAAPR